VSSTGPERHPTPGSVIQGPHGPVALKVHSCVWSGTHPANSLAAIADCLDAGVVRAEFDLRMLQDRDFVLLHDDELRREDGTVAPANDVRLAELPRGGISPATPSRPALLSEFVQMLEGSTGTTIFEVDGHDEAAWPWARAEELAGTLEPVRNRVVVAGQNDANLRRLARIDPQVPLGFDPAAHFDWIDPSDTHPMAPPAGAYDYRDADPVARQRTMPIGAYLRRRFESLLELVPGRHELHLRLETFERLLDDGFDELVPMLHARQLLLDVWTLDRGSPGWRGRLDRAVTAGIDMLTTNTAPAIAAELSTPRSGAASP
jgi:glycerophosphoryl diester phosphodiesterase